MVFPVATQGIEAFKVDAVVAGLVDGQFLFAVTVVVLLDFGIGRRFAVFLGGRLVLGGGVLELEDGVFLQLLLDALLQGHYRELQNLHGLYHAWIEDDGLF